MLSIYVIKYLILSLIVYNYRLYCFGIGEKNKTIFKYFLGFDFILSKKGQQMMI
jgi:hypothetical protein